MKKKEKKDQKEKSEQNIQKKITRNILIPCR